MPSVSIIYRKDKVNKKGASPIHFRIIKDRKVSYISTGVSITKDCWDEKNLRVKAKHKNSARMNSLISNKFTELQDEFFKHETVSKSSTTRQLKDKIYGKKAEDFFSFADEVVNSYKDDGKISTYITHRASISTLRDYAKGSTLMFQDITPAYLTKYERYLQTKQYLKTNTIHKHLKFLRKLFNDAVRQDKIEIEHNPFPRVNLKLENTSRSFLTAEELDAFENVATTAGEKLDLHKKMFVFAAYAGGLRISDVLTLQWKDFDGTHINLSVRKTKTQLSIKLPNKAIQIVNGFKTVKNKPTDFIFPMLANGINLKDAQISYSKISSATAYINKNLKILAQRANIDKSLSFHVSRHTWATSALKKGISIDKVSKLMGHAQIRETLIYAKIVNSELDKAMDVFND